MSVTIEDIKAMDASKAKEALDGLYEKSPWVAEAMSTRISKCGDTLTSFASEMKSIVDNASDELKLELIRNHPDLAAKASVAESMTDESKEEQARAGLNTLTIEEMQQFTEYNEEYKKKFEFPFILAVRNATKYTILNAFKSRLDNSKSIEFHECLTQIHKIAWMRLLQKVQFKPVGFLTCHVLDTACGCPAAGMRITLSRVNGNNRILIKEFITNDDGRTGRALDGVDFTPGTYEWIFYCGPYFASKGLYTTGTPFLDEVPIRFGIDNPEDHYHVPLLVSPWSFSTYRGS